MAYRQEKEVELGGFWLIFTSLLATAAAVAPKAIGGAPGRPEASTVPLFTSQVDVQKQIDEILAKSRAGQEALVAEEQAKKMAVWQKALYGVLIIVGGVVIWKKVKKRK